MKSVKINIKSLELLDNAAAIALYNDCAALYRDDANCTAIDRDAFERFLHERFQIVQERDDGELFAIARVDYRREHSEERIIWCSLMIDNATCIADEDAKELDFFMSRQ